MRWVEPFAGGAACALHLAQQGPPPVSWLGGKRLLAPAITRALVGGRRPDAYLLGDAGPWGWVWAELIKPGMAEAVADAVEEIAARHDGAEATWRAMEADAVPPPSAMRTAAWCILQRGAFRSKPVTIRGSRWHTPGFVGLQGKTLSAANLAKALRRIAGFSRWHVRAVHGYAADLADELGEHDVVYLDPPYVGTTGYSVGCSREDVVALALRLHEQGCVVGVSERGPVEELAGWGRIDLSHVTRRSRHDWLTVSPGVRP